MRDTRYEIRDKRSRHPPTFHLLLSTSPNSLISNPFSLIPPLAPIPLYPNSLVPYTLFPIPYSLFPNPSSLLSPPSSPFSHVLP